MTKHRNAAAFADTATPGGFIYMMGYLATVLAGVMALGAGAAVALSWPDIRRYLHISSL